ncbi:RxLR effector candidate protein [Elysia marginata]|uniref:RxLR effector candidate protein n=1 Tax=Elysia marginata TaxID=1093978 RepID=A0AAV4GUD6_9GAST|nr:RxLR effector candidate protein [Elysia marginata]
MVRRILVKYPYEVEKALARLNNNRACGEGGIPGELIKYGADTLAKVICNILNRVFSEHGDINGDLDHLRDIAQNRSDWKHRTTATYRSAQAETSVDVAADGR